MSTPRRRRYVRLQVCWLLGAVLVLAALDRASAGAVVLLGVLGVLVVDELATPTAVEPRWRGRTRWLIRCGLGLAVAVVIYRLASLLAPGVVA
jgi:hypothetical protein